MPAPWNPRVCLPFHSAVDRCTQRIRSAPTVEFTAGEQVKSRRSTTKAASGSKRAKRRVLIYRTALLLGEIRGRHRSGGRYLHSFGKGVRCKTYGLPDGSIQIKGLYGRLWGNLPEPSARSRRK